LLRAWTTLIFYKLREIERPWMDVFLLHISAHFMPGRNWTWYVIFLVCHAMYLSARRAAEVRVQKHPLDAP
jgi:hypothetical protein